MSDIDTPDILTEPIDTVQMSVAMTKHLFDEVDARPGIEHHLRADVERFVAEKYRNQQVYVVHGEVKFIKGEPHDWIVEMQQPEYAAVLRSKVYRGIDNPQLTC